MDQNLGLIWERCLKFMRDNLSASEHEDVKKLEHSFDLLFDRVQPVSLINHNLTLLVPSDFYKEYIEENYLSLLSAALKKNIGKGVKLWYSVMENKPQGLEKPATQNYKGISVQAPKVQEVLPTTVSKSLVNPFVVPGIKKVNIDANLNPNLSFDNFVEGESNKFACTVAKTIAKRPGATSFNPLFIHGGVGVGKTHLAHAIGLDIKQNLPDKVVLYLSSEKFIQQFVSAAKAQNKTDFGNFYQMVDVLIIDDIQFLGGAAKTQQEFFHTFTNLYDSNKQIIISSDRSPDDLKLLEERLLTRFRWGLTANIEPPDFELRCKILKDKMTEHEVAKMVPNEVIEYIATNCENDVRHLEGAITRLYAYAAMMGPKEINLEFAVDALKDYIGKSIYITNDIQKIQKAVADYYHITIEDLKSKKRTSNINYPRQIAMYLCRMTTSETIIKIGLEFGNRDHSTVLHSYDKINNEIQNDENNIRQVIEDIKNKIVN